MICGQSLHKIPGGNNMALKFLRDSLDGLDDAEKALYQEKDGKFQLAVEGLPENEDLAGLKAKVDQLLGEKKAATAKAKEAEDAAREAAEKAARSSGDVAALDKSWQEKYDARESETKGIIEGMSSSVNKLMVDNVASVMASELAVQGSADVLIPHIRSRLAVEQRGEEFVTVVNGIDGRASAATIDELKAEIGGNAAFAPIIVASQASGGGASGQNSGRATPKTITRIQFEGMDNAGRLEFSKSGGAVTD